MASPVADQILAAIEDVERACGSNAHLVEDWVIGPVVEFANDGRLLPIEEITGETRVMARVLPADLDYAAADLHEAEHLNLLAKCDRCLKPGAIPVSRLLIPVGGSAVSLDLCSECRGYLMQNFHPITWAR